MQTIGKPISAPGRSVKHVALSLATHGAVLLFIVAALHRHTGFVAPYRLPGEKNGTNFVIAYLPDRAPEQSATAKPKDNPASAEPRLLVPNPATQPRESSAPLVVNTSPASPDPNAATGSDALGSGNISIALTSYFPPPHPDLSVLPHGAKGDVVLDVVIDSNGKISDLKQMSGIGYGIDEIVIATVQQWVWRPALQNGRPVASEQELHFHYERG